MGYLSPYEVLQFGMTCKSLFLAAGEPRLWKRLRFRGRNLNFQMGQLVVSRVANMEFLEVLGGKEEMMSASVSGMKVGRDRRDEWWFGVGTRDVRTMMKLEKGQGEGEGFDADVLELFCMSCKELRGFRCSGCALDDQRIVQLSMNGIETLELCSVSGLTDAGLQQVGVTWLTELCLDDMRFEGHGLEDVLSKCGRQLKALSLRDTQIEMWSDWRSVLEVCGVLESFDCGGCNVEMDDEQFVELMSGMDRRLMALNISGQRAIGLEGLNTGLKNAKRTLQVLAMDQCEQLCCDVGCRVIGKRMGRKLRKLFVYGGSITDVGLGILGRKCPGMQVFHAGFNEFSSKGISDLMDSCSKLQELSVRRTDHEGLVGELMFGAVLL
eukprot:TRINITY_DN3955_c0_g1_i2.p1 TRINITY_DN3955_c0_g1~~TRINITY_DN3955_c0_g1_i2.p1  ORF type:complete len:381 (-),score=99.17 TRINITY_DN3955_c0_g1_i2:96-1238(-)